MSGIVRSITHWTGGGGRANDTDRTHYHRITEFDGMIVEGKEEIEDNIVTSDNDYAAHTLRLNTGSAGFALAGMRGATESPFDPGPSPINREQFEAHCKMLAEFHQSYGIPVTRETCLTHAEVEPILGVKQRNKWDLTRLPFDPTIRGALPVGDYMRKRVKSYMTLDMPAVSENRPILREGSRGIFVQELQDLLAGNGHFSGKQDGIFGPRTKAAVAAFQSTRGLLADGIVGPQTWDALMRVEPLPAREVTVSDLRKAGSETIKAADRGTASAGVAGGLAAIGALNEVAKTAVATVEDTAETSQNLVQVLVQLWPYALVAVLAVAGWFLFQRIKDRRVQDAIEGKNLAR